jgi:uncharacterized protein YjbI with pentapeptide repeats
LRGAWLSGRFHGARFDDALVEGAVLLGAGGLDESLTGHLAERGAVVDANTFIAALRQGMSATGRHAAGFRLQGADLEGLSFAGTNLHSADLRSATLRGADLRDCNLCWAKMGEARLDSAALDKARFVGADLRGASLARVTASGASFSNAKLSHADFAAADLRGADFSHADLRCANLRGARIDGCQWNAAILEGVRGLDLVVERDLRRQAARWKHDLNATLGAIMRVSAWPAWVVGMLGGLVCGAMLFWGRPGQRGLALGLTVFQLVALAPLAVLALFMFTGSSPAAQLNSGYGVWSWWVGMFFPILGALAFGGLVFLAVVPVWIVRRRLSTELPMPLVLAAAAFTGLALLASLPCLLSLAPSA